MVDGLFAPWHIIIIGLLVVVVFGSKRLPESARAIGQSLRILKAETRELHDDGRAPSGAVPVAGGLAAAQPPSGLAAEATGAGLAPANQVPRYDAFTGRPLDRPAVPPQ